MIFKNFGAIVYASGAMTFRKVSHKADSVIASASLYTRSGVI